MTESGSSARVWPAAIVAFIVLSVSAGVLGGLVSALKLHLTKLPIEAPDGIKLHTLPVSFPRNNPRWQQVGSDTISSAEEAAELGTDNYVTRWYRRVQEPGDESRPITVQVHIAYYTGMIDTVPHVPERCMLGGGMEYAGETEVVDIPLDMERLTPDPDSAADESGRPIWMSRSQEVHRRIRLPRGVENLQARITPFRDQAAKTTVYAGYFFIANGGVARSANDVRLLAFALNDRYAFYTKVQFMSQSVQSSQELAAYAADMLDDLFPEIMRRLPDWVEVEAGRYPADNPRQGRPEQITVDSSPSS